MLQKAQEELRKGIAPTSANKLKYEDLRSILVADYTDSGKLEMRGDEIVITGKTGLLKALDGHFSDMNVQAITTDEIRKFIAKRKAEGVTGPAINRNLARPAQVQAGATGAKDFRHAVLPDGQGVRAPRRVRGARRI